MYCILPVMYIDFVSNVPKYFCITKYLINKNAAPSKSNVSNSFNLIIAACSTTLVSFVSILRAL